MWNLDPSWKRFTFILIVMHFFQSLIVEPTCHWEKRLSWLSLRFIQVPRGQTLNRIFASHFKIHGVSKKAEHRMSNLNVASDGGHSSENKRRKQSEGRAWGELSLVGWSETIRSVQLLHKVRVWKTLNKDTAQGESALRARSLRRGVWTCCPQTKST